MEMEMEMERSPGNLVINGGLGVRLPVGYRFHPTDEELVVHYLKRKVFGVPLPASVIPDLDVFHTHPWSLPGDLKEKRYFFSKREGNIDGNDKKRKRVKTAGSGYWKLIGKERKIVDSLSNEAVGLRKSLVFCLSTPYFETTTNTNNTKWVMHEYSLFGNQMSKKASREEPWVVYSLFQKKRKPRGRHGLGVRNYIHDRLSFMVEAGDHEGHPPQPASSCFSEVTDEISSCGYLLDHEQEETSSISADYNISFCSSFSRMRNQH